MDERRARFLAVQPLGCTGTYRSYIINHGLGCDMVRANVEKAGSGQAERRGRMGCLLGAPRLPGDL